MEWKSALLLTLIKSPGTKSSKVCTNQKNLYYKLPIVILNSSELLECADVMELQVKTDLFSLVLCWISLVINEIIAPDVSGVFTLSGQANQVL
jgi:hypothetical protein